MLTKEERAALRQGLKDGGIVGDHQRDTIIDILEPRLAQTVTREQVARAMLLLDPYYFSYHWPGDPAKTWLNSSKNIPESSCPAEELMVARFLMRADAILALFAPPSDQKENT